MIPLSSIQGSPSARHSSLKALQSRLAEIFAGKRKSEMRVMVVGIPNVGKSTLINALVGRRKAQTGKQPGVTRGPQWLRASPKLSILDTPGVLLPEAQRLSETSLWKLVLIGAMKEGLFSPEGAAAYLIQRLREEDPEILQRTLPLATRLPSRTEEIFKSLGDAWGFLQKGGVIETGKAAGRLIKMFQERRFGRITLESPEEMQPPQGSPEEM